MVALLLLHFHENTCMDVCVPTTYVVCTYVSIYGCGCGLCMSLMVWRWHSRVAGGRRGQIFFIRYTCTCVICTTSKLSVYSSRSLVGIYYRHFPRMFSFDLARRVYEMKFDYWYLFNRDWNKNNDLSSERFVINAILFWLILCFCLRIIFLLAYHVSSKVSEW